MAGTFGSVAWSGVKVVADAKTKKSRAEQAAESAEVWRMIDRIIELAEAESGSPWVDGRYVADVGTLQRLLGVPVLLGKAWQSGVPSRALDVWVAYELRRAGFEREAVWPRTTSPRVIPMPITGLVEALESGTQAQKVVATAVRDEIDSGRIKGSVAGATASVLGKNYSKQVDVLMSDWNTGPQILISTKRMDSSFANNVANRIEESYGDAKNLRGRHPLAALGFLFALSADAFVTKAATARWLMNQLEKMGDETDAYTAVCFLVIEDNNGALRALGVDEESVEDPLGPPLQQEQTTALSKTEQAAEALSDPEEAKDASSEQEETADASSEQEETADASSEKQETADPSFDLEARLSDIPEIVVRADLVGLVPDGAGPAALYRLPESLQPGAFFQAIIEHVLTVTPVSEHTEARIRAGWPYVPPKVRKPRSTRSQQPAG